MHCILLAVSLSFWRCLSRSINFSEKWGSRENSNSFFLYPGVRSLLPIGNSGGPHPPSPASSTPREGQAGAMAFEAAEPYYQVSSSNHGFIHTLSQNNACYQPLCGADNVLVPNTSI